MPEKIKLGCKVKIKMTGNEGELLGIWESKHDVQYNIRYKDDVKNLHDLWFYREDFKILNDGE